jgi:hypothetical protein
MRLPGDSAFTSRLCKPAQRRINNGHRSNGRKSNKEGHLSHLAQVAFVEAAGIEPASRDISMQASTCVVGSFAPSPDASPTDGAPHGLVGSLFDLGRGQQRPETIRN